jgi:hypothetical protein
VNFICKLFLLERSWRESRIRWPHDILYLNILLIATMVWWAHWNIKLGLLYRGVEINELSALRHSLALPFISMWLLHSWRRFLEYVLLSVYTMKRGWRYIHFLRGRSSFKYQRWSLKCTNFACAAPSWRLPKSIFRIVCRALLLY